MKPTAATMSTAFKIRPLVPQSFIQRLVRQFPAENAVIELNNLLATQAILSITPAGLLAIEQRYGFPLSQYRLNLEEFYAVHLNDKLRDRHLLKSDLADLTHLQTLFQLPVQSVEMLHARIGEMVYRQRVHEAVQYGQLSDTEKAALSELRQLISLPSDLADTIYNDVCQAELARFVQECGVDARITPDEELRLQAVSKNLGVKFEGHTKRTIERFKRYWIIENTSLPVVMVSVSLQKLEICYYQANKVDWYEERATARRTTYDEHYEYHQSFDIVNLQSNDSSPRKDTFSILKRIQIGNLYLTNKRLIFESQDKTTSIKLTTINRVKAYKQGILVDKLTGKPMLLLVDRDADGLALLCQRLICLAA